MCTDIVLLQRLKSHVFTPLEISLLLQTKVTKNCYYQMRFLGFATEMPTGRRPLGELTVHPQTPSRILGDCFVARKGKERGNGLGKEGDKQGGKERYRKKKRRGERRGRKGCAMSASENSLKIHCMAPNASKPIFGPRTSLRELATLLQPPRRLGRFLFPYPSCLQAFGVSISSPHQRRLGS